MRVVTGYFSLRVTGTVPADQATVSVAPTELLLRVNRPDPELKVNGTAFGIEEVSALDGGVQVDTIPFSFAASPFELRLTPSTPLRAGGIYRVLNRINVTPVTLATFSIAP